MSPDPLECITCVSAATHTSGKRGVYFRIAAGGSEVIVVMPVNEARDLVADFNAAIVQAELPGSETKQ